MCHVVLFISHLCVIFCSLSVFTCVSFVKQPLSVCVYSLCAPWWGVRPVLLTCSFTFTWAFPCVSLCLLVVCSCFFVPCVLYWFELWLSWSWYFGYFALLGFLDSLLLFCFFCLFVFQFLMKSSFFVLNPSCLLGVFAFLPNLTKIVWMYHHHLVLLQSF